MNRLTSIAAGLLLIAVASGSARAELWTATFSGFALETSTGASGTQIQTFTWNPADAVVANTGATGVTFSVPGALNESGFFSQAPFASGASGQMTSSVSNFATIGGRTTLSGISTPVPSFWSSPTVTARFFAPGSGISGGRPGVWEWYADFPPSVQVTMSVAPAVVGPVPEPATLVLSVVGLAGLALSRRASKLRPS